MLLALVIIDTLLCHCTTFWRSVAWTTFTELSIPGVSTKILYLWLHIFLVVYGSSLFCRFFSHKGSDFGSTDTTCVWYVAQQRIPKSFALMVLCALTLRGQIHWLLGVISLHSSQPNSQTHIHPHIMDEHSSGNWTVWWFSGTSQSYTSALSIDLWSQRQVRLRQGLHHLKTIQLAVALQSTINTCNIHQPESAEGRITDGFSATGWLNQALHTHLH